VQILKKIFITRRVSVIKHWVRMRSLKRGKRREYREYLNTQFWRSLSKKGWDTSARVILLAEALLGTVDVNHQYTSALCIGCRNTVEIDVLRRKGITNVVGIDIYSKHSDIIVMDMHDMSFSDNSFDIVFSCHSFEHAYNPERVAQEMMRVLRSHGVIAIEVPVHYKTTSADLIDVRTPERLLEFFAPYVEKIFFCEEQPPTTHRNALGIAIIRIVFSVNKAMFMDTGRERSISSPTSRL